MPLATTHILVAIILIELFREFVVKNNHKFPRYYILIAALGGVIPDFDFAVYYVVSFFGFTFDQIHRTFLHSIFIPLILFLIGLFIFYTGIKNSEFGKRHIALHTTFFILAAGALLHLALDSVLSGYIQPFYPFSTMQFGLNIVQYLPANWQDSFPAVLDAILLLFWICWMEFKVKVRDYF